MMWQTICGDNPDSVNKYKNERNRDKDQQYACGQTHSGNNFVFPLWSRRIAPIEANTMPINVKNEDNPNMSMPPFPGIV